VPALHFIAARGGLARVQPDGIALGLDRGPVFERSLVPASLNLAAGDALILATEGAYKLPGGDGQPIGETGFLKAVLAAAKSGVSGLPERILHALAGKQRAPTDDVTLVTAARAAKPS
jgi:serine phosphatase RsbU (regulator of sigma subunit)